MDRVNLKLVINATMVDADTGKIEATPFKGDMTFEYNGVPYADALDVQASFAQALNDHGARMIQKGRDWAKKQK